MAIQASPVHPKSSSDIYLQTKLPKLLLKQFAHALYELGRLNGPSEKDVGCTLMQRAVRSAQINGHAEWTFAKGEVFCLIAGDDCSAPELKRKARRRGSTGTQ